MANNDIALAKRYDPTAIDMAVGNPFALQELIGKRPIAYPSFGGEDDVRAVLADFTAEMCGRKPKHIVVTNGAKQAIAAGLFAIKQAGCRTISIEAPHWPTHCTLAQYAGLIVTDEAAHASLITSPNNPDGKTTTKPATLWDAAYFCPAYDHTGRPPPQFWGMSAWSGAKLFGLCDEHTGWLATDDDDDAHAAALYVEATTSGVAVPMQASLMTTAYTFDRRKWSYLQEIIEQRGNEAFGLLEKRFGVGLSSAGAMFLYCQIDNPAFATWAAQHKVRALPGSVFHDPRPNFWRFNLGCSSQTWREFVRALGAADGQAGV